jgi:hypothetical protein
MRPVIFPLASVFRILLFISKAYPDTVSLIILPIAKITLFILLVFLKPYSVFKPINPVPKVNKVFFAVIYHLSKPMSQSISDLACVNPVLLRTRISTFARHYSHLVLTLINIFICKLFYSVAILKVISPLTNKLVIPA